MTARSRARRVLLAAAVVATAGALAAPASASGGETSSYIVVLHDSVRSASAVADEHRRSHDAKVTHTYEHALKGYAAQLTRQGYAGVVSDRRVKYVEPDGVAYPSLTTQPGATWGLDRIDQKDRPLNGTFTYTMTGAEVRAYVIDSGIRADHAEFGNRVETGKSFLPSKQGDTSDCNGHGTHVAGTIGGGTYGVAKGVTLIPARVFDCSGGAQWSWVIDAVNWVTSDASAAGKRAVANMSLSGGAHTALDDAVRGSISQGITYALAAGNDSGDACRKSPARVSEALTVGATDKSDTRASFSNYGKCLDLFAPGVGIESAWHTGATDVIAISGTSMSAPHVAGVAAQHLQAYPTASPAAVATAIVNSATPNKVSRPGKGSPNRLLYTPTS